MYNAIDLGELKRMANLAEAAQPELFDMSVLFGSRSCGTVGCLLGTWAMNTPDDRLAFRLENTTMMDGIQTSGPAGVRERFGIGESVVSFLFFRHRHFRQFGMAPDAMSLNQPQAIARLRKFIRYVERKRALWQDHADLMAMSKRDRFARMFPVQMAANSWKLDGQTFVVQNEQGKFNIWLAGCYQSDEWVDHLASICEEPLLSQCRAALREPATHLTPVAEPV